MEEWVNRALKRWPNVPALYGWLRLDRRGRWLIKGETISRPQINDVINRNYAADERGCWYFQNGPQRGYMQLAYAPFVLLVQESSGALVTHTGLPVNQVSKVFIDEDGALIVVTEHGAGALLDSDLDWALERMTINAKVIDESDLAQALSLPNGAVTKIVFTYSSTQLPIARLDFSAAPAQLNFVRDPAPLALSSD